MSDIAGFYLASDAKTFEAKTKALSNKFAVMERRLGDGPSFSGLNFSLVDAVFGPIFQYFDVFDQIGEFGIQANTPKVSRWRAALAARPSIQTAVSPDYDARLWAFLMSKGSFLSGCIPVR